MTTTPPDEAASQCKGWPFLCSVRRKPRRSRSSRECTRVPLWPLASVTPCIICIKMMRTT